MAAAGFLSKWSFFSFLKIKLGNHGFNGRCLPIGHQMSYDSKLLKKKKKKKKKKK